MQSKQQAFPTMRAALSSNCNLWNGAELLEPLPDIIPLTLLNEYFTSYPQDVDKVVLNIKRAL